MFNLLRSYYCTIEQRLYQVDAKIFSPIETNFRKAARKTSVNFIQIGRVSTLVENYRDFFVELNQDELTQARSQWTRSF